MFEPEIIFTREQYEKYYSERFIYGKELSDVLEIMKRHDSYRILVLGAPGSGKTTLLYQLSHYTANKKPTEIIRGYDIRDNIYALLKQKETPIYIDGLDEMKNPYSLLQYLNANKCDKLVCTSRPNMPLDIYFTHIITLNPTQEQIMLLIKKLGLNNPLFHSLTNKININGGTEITPRDILSCIVDSIHNSDIRKFHSKYSNFLYQYGNGIDFSSDIIPSEDKIIIPSKNIIKGITVVGDTLLKKAKEEPRIIHNFSPREFEEFVCELLDKQGYNVKLTKQTRDGGKDIIVVQKSILGEFCIYVECKKYDTSRPISVSLVRELYGTVMVDNATAGMIITTSHFSKDAKEYSLELYLKVAIQFYHNPTLFLLVNKNLNGMNFYNHFGFVHHPFFYAVT